ncbi:MAG: histidine kinase, partial [Syntrophobacteraceae bacterium CG07_land_8_20_14_0_80_61_8]
MAIITISRGSFSHGAEVAERVAERLGYQCISREVLLDASERFHIPEMKLVQAIHDSPNILQRFQFGKQAYIAYIQWALAQRVRSGRAVYHGFAGHLLLPRIPHVLRVRILASMEQRVAAKMAQARISEREALAVINKDDEERRKWSKALYGVDPRDSSLYDL